MEIFDNFCWFFELLLYDFTKSLNFARFGGSFEFDLVSFVDFILATRYQYVIKCVEHLTVITMWTLRFKAFVIVWRRNQILLHPYPLYQAWFLYKLLIIFYAINVFVMPENIQTLAALKVIRIIFLIILSIFEVLHHRLVNDGLSPSFLVI